MKRIKGNDNTSLFIVPTPIGNIEDITLRALKTLRFVPVILAERRSTIIKLLKYYNVDISSKKIIVYREDNHKSVVGAVLGFLKKQSLALVSEAGTPILADPGLDLIHAIGNHYGNLDKIKVLPGPSAVVSGVVGFPVKSGRFLFLGFMPRKASHIKRLFPEFLVAYLAKIKASIVFFESPYRIRGTLETLREYLKQFNNIETYVGLAKELSKLHESRVWGRLDKIDTLLQGFVIKGEFVVVLTFDTIE